MFTLHCGAIREATPEEFVAWAGVRENLVLRYSEWRDAYVLTHFLGVNWGTESDPVFFASTVCGGAKSGYTLRAGNLISALENHAIAFAAMKG